MTPFMIGVTFVFVVVMGLFALAERQQRHKNDDK